MHPPADGRAYGGLDYHLEFHEIPGAWGDLPAAAGFFSRTGLKDLGLLFFSGGFLMEVTLNVLLYAACLCLLWPGFLRILSGRKGFWEAVRTRGWVFLCVGLVQLLLYGGLYLLMIVSWSGPVGRLMGDSPTEFLALLLGAVQVGTFLAVIFFVRMFFSFLKIGLADAASRNPFHPAWPALKTAVRTLYLAAGFFLGLFIVWALVTRLTGFNFATLILRDYLWLAGWAFLIRLSPAPADPSPQR
jgi:hypothetical protein